MRGRLIASRVALGHTVLYSVLRKLVTKTPVLSKEIAGRPPGQVIPFVGASGQRNSDYTLAVANVNPCTRQQSRDSNIADAVTELFVLTTPHSPFRVQNRLRGTPPGGTAAHGCVI
jgi:hypothetical protein